MSDEFGRSLVGDRYNQEWAHGFWMNAWREIVARVEGVPVDGAKGERIRTHYFPLLDEAYTNRDPQAWAKIVRNLNVGCPISAHYHQWRVFTPIPGNVQSRPNLEEKEALPRLPF